MTSKSRPGSHRELIFQEVHNGYYGADYEANELQACYEKLVKQKTFEISKDISKKRICYPEMKLEEVFQELYARKHVSVSLEHAVYTG